VSAAGSLKFTSIADADTPQSLLMITIRLQKKSFLKNVDGQQDLYHTRTVRCIDFHTFTGTGIFFQHHDESNREESEAGDRDEEQAAVGDFDSQERPDVAIDRLTERDKKQEARVTREPTDGSLLLRRKEETGNGRPVMSGSLDGDGSTDAHGEALQTKGDQQQQAPLKMLRG